MTIYSAVWIQYTNVTDGQTDGRTDGHDATAKTALMRCVARVKTVRFGSFIFYRSVTVRSVRLDRQLIAITTWHITVRLVIR